MAYYNAQQGIKNFKESPAQLGTFFSKDNWKLVCNIGHGFELYNPQGEMILKTDHAWEPLRAEDENGNMFEVHMVTFEEIYGRHREQAVKFGVAHFTPGTVVRLTSDHPVRNHIHDGQNIFTVKSVEEVDCGNYLVTFDGIDPVLNSDAGFSINSFWIAEIISRPAGKAKLLDRFPVSEHRLMDLVSTIKGGYMPLNSFCSLAVAIAIEKNEHIGESRIIDETKLFDRLKAMGLIRAFGYARQPVVKVKPALKFIRKNPHWLLASAKESLEQRAKDYEEDMERSFDYA